MTVPSSQIVDTGAPSGRFPALRAFLSVQQETIVADLVRELADFAHYRPLTNEQRMERVSGNLDDYFAGLADPQHFSILNEEELRPLLAQGLDQDNSLQLMSIYRRHILAAGLLALKAGITDAADGIQALMELVDQRTRTIAQFFENRLRIFQTLVDRSPDGIGVSDLAGNQIHPNPAFKALLGYGDELVGMHFAKYVVDNDPAVMEDLATHGIWQGNNIYRRKDGSTIRCHSTVFLIPGPDGLPTAMGGVIRDITQQVQAEEELQRQTEEFKTFYALAENAPDGVLVASSQGVIRYANPSMRTMLAYPDMQGLQIMEHLDGTPEIFNDITVKMGTQGFWSGTLGYRRSDGRVVQCQASSYLIQMANNDSVIASIVRDITAQQRAEQERMELQEQVIAAQQAALRELSTPLIPLADGLVAMPLIGSIDSARAQQIVEGLLQGVSTNRAMTAIIDITGVPVVDTQVAGALVRAAQAVELLGARVVLTGIRPEVAQTLVGIGVSLGSITTRSTLQDGITYALSQKGR
jgi:rsbT co-antagonist protein RsbR